MGGATLGAVAIIGGTVAATPAEAQRCTDRDGGRYSDPVGRGRWCRRRRRRTGITDRDPHDPVGNGRGRRRRYGSGITDSDPGDPVGNGRGRRRTGITDSDPSDPVGNGRG